VQLVMCNSYNLDSMNEMLIVFTNFDWNLTFARLGKSQKCWKLKALNLLSLSLCYMLPHLLLATFYPDYVPLANRLLGPSQLNVACRVLRLDFYLPKSTSQILSLLFLLLSALCAWPLEGVLLQFTGETKGFPKMTRTTSRSEQT